VRAGRFVRQLTGYPAFVPAPLPPDPPLVMDSELLSLLSEADLASGRLDGVSSSPQLYLSAYLKTHRIEYYDRLTAIRLDGNWEGWIKFFLRGVVEVSVEATKTARSILALREAHRQVVDTPQLLDYLFERPLISV
jgi:hypothetical protein